MCQDEARVACVTFAVVKKKESKPALFLPPSPGLPRGGGVKKNTLPVKQQVGFEPGTFGLQLNALTTWLQCQ